jgi:hypothetical protein
MNISAQLSRLPKAIPLALALAALVAPVAQGGEVRPNVILRNDIAHFGNDSGSPERANTILRNDIAHFGNDSRRPAPTAAPAHVESPAPVVVRVSGGFDWISAGVGAAGGLGLVLAIGVAASAMRARQRTHEARA